MKKISSNSTGFYKKTFPAIWFGFLAFFGATALMSGAASEGSWMFLIMPCVMAVFGYFLMKKVVWDLMDEVHDCGDSLLIKNGAEEETIALSNVMNVSGSTNMNPPRVTLRLVKPGKFGSEIAFSPVAKRSFNPFAKNEVIEDLIVRVDQARLKRVV